MAVTEATLPPLSIYRRTIHASLERVWENVLDWEHLPYLHRTSFLAIRLLRGSSGGWRAVVSVPSSAGPRDATIEVELDRPNLRYRTRTLEGAGSGTEILTVLQPVAERSTAITVEFRIPGAGRGTAEAYRLLYARLWDEDEAMMIRRQRVLDADEGFRPGAAVGACRVPLGPVARLRESLPLLMRVDGAPIRMLDVDGRLHAHATVCPHRGGPLEDAAVTEGCVRCPWHGYRFDVRTGENADALPLRLDCAAAVLVDDVTGEASLAFGER